jgi:hypothetical protein
VRHRWKSELPFLGASTSRHPTGRDRLRRRRPAHFRLGACFACTGSQATQSRARAPSAVPTSLDARAVDVDPRVSRWATLRPCLRHWKARCAYRSQRITRSIAARAAVVLRLKKISRRSRAAGKDSGRGAEIVDSRQEKVERRGRPLRGESGEWKVKRSTPGEPCPATSGEPPDATGSGNGFPAGVGARRILAPAAPGRRPHRQ